MVQHLIIAFGGMERVVSGHPATEALPREAERIGARRVFLMVSRTLDRETDAIAAIRTALGERFAGQYDGMPPHTPREAVLDAAAQARAADADLIVTIGGGSLTDAGKLVQLCLRHEVRDVDGLEPFRVVTDADGTTHRPQYEGPQVRMVAVPTTLSGGEFNSNAGCTDTRRQSKQSFDHPLHVPRVVILDPALTVHTPEWVWLSTGMRAVDHATEALCSDFANPHSDAGALQALRLLGVGLLRSHRHPDNLEGREQCQLGAWLSLQGRASGVPMGASHAIGHVLGGTCGVPHGYTSCVMLPAVLRYNAPVNAGQQALVSEALGRPGVPAADVVAELVAALGLPGTLAAVGVGAERFAEIAAHAMHDRWIHTNPRPIRTPQQVEEILRLAQ